MAQEAPDAMAIAVRPSAEVKAEPGPAVPGNLVVYDEDGDLTIRVGPGLDAFRVDSKTLSRSSVVFKKMLFGGFAESRPPDGSDWVVDLPDDDGFAMEVLFRIAHGAFAMVPAQLSLRGLYTLLAHTEKYDANHLLRPWAGAWVRSPAVRKQTEEPELLCVAWGLGDFDLFARMLDKMINECLVDAGGNLVYGRRRTQQGHSVSPRGILAPSEFVFNTLVHLVPRDIEDIILSSRRKLVRAELRAYVDLYADCKKSQRCLSQTAGSVTRWKCDSMVLGSLIKSLDCLGIDIGAPNAAELYRGSLADLRTLLSGAYLVTYCGTQCDGKITRSLAEGGEKAAKLKTLLVAVRDAHKVYLESQARKTGL